MVHIQGTPLEQLHAHLLLVGTVAGGLAAKRGEIAKIRKYAARCAAQNPPIRFIPLAFDTTGAAGPETHKTLRDIARRASCHSGLSDQDALRLIRTHVSSTLMKYFALQVNVRGTGPPRINFLPPQC